MSAPGIENECDLAGLWRRQVALHPQRVALIEGTASVSIGELDRWSEHVAQAMHGAGVRPGDVVALLGERGGAAVAALLAVAKCGATYVPVEPHLPSMRRDAMLQQAQPRALLLLDEASRMTHQQSPALHVAPAIELSASARGAAVQPIDWPDYPRDIPLYLLYTSGSSGAPKGVLGTQRGLLNRLEWMWRAFAFAAGERMAQRTSLGFVDSVAEIWGALLQDVPLVIVPPAALADIDELVTLIANARVTRMVVVPSLLSTVLASGRPLAQEWSALRYCVTSGEALPPQLAAQLGRVLPQCRLLNLYGMTEAAADASWHEVDTAVAHDTVPIGRPIDHMRIALLDDELRPVPPGDVGRVYIGGPGLAIGYHRQPALTAVSFLPDPDPCHAGERLYSTGDYARCNAAGELEYRGRQDNQVKVRGHRVELSEIVRHAREHPAVFDGLALVSEALADDIQLFVGIRPQMELTAAGMKGFLAARLPRYMVPGFVHVRQELPLLPNGKIDRRTLLASLGRAAQSGEPPATQSEQAVAAIWQELLRIDAPTRCSGFLELGGNSLQAALAVTRLRAAFGVPLSVPELLDCPDLARLAQLLEQRSAHKRVLQRADVGHGTVELLDF